MKCKRVYILGFNVLVLVSLLWPASVALATKLSYHVTAIQANKFPARYFAPYDYVNPGSGDFVQAAQQTGVKYYSLAFILSSGGCQASWQGAGGAVSASDAMKTDIDQLRQLGGDVIISFGGYGGTELARACPDATSLQQQYQDVIDAYGVSHLDFDIEGASETDPASIDRRSQAIAGLEKANKGLIVSYTLSVEAPNLHLRAPQIVRSAKKYNVRIDVVNAMTMDYTPNVPPNKMGTDAIEAVNNVKRDLLAIGISAEIGIIPMIGVNDHSPEVFTLQDAQQVLKFANQDNNVAELSMWSLGRDTACPGGATGGAASASCSGVTQQQYGFANFFNTFTGNSKIPVPWPKSPLLPKPQLPKPRPLSKPS
jgi:hypothetical protein